MISVPEALAILDRIAPSSKQTLPVAEATGSVLAESALAVCDLPPFDQSAMDGYALVAEDTAGASADVPVRLAVSFEAPAGRATAHPPLSSGRTARIFTGAVVPDGADAVIMQEQTSRQGDTVAVHVPVDAGNNIRRQGEEIARGAVIAETGALITPGLAAAVAMAGVAEVAVRRVQRVTVLVTGDEIVPPGQPLQLGQVYDCNSIQIESWLRAAGVEDVAVERLPDALDKTAERVDAALSASDLVVTAGGVSVGKYDFVIPATEQVGGERLFWKVRQKPGKPIYAAIREGTPLLGLPGNPGAVFCGLNVFVRRAIDRLTGRTPRPLDKGTLGFSVRQRPERGQWIRARFTTDADGSARLVPLGGQASHMLGNLASCNALVWVSAGEGSVEAGTVVEWFPV